MHLPAKDKMCYDLILYHTRLHREEKDAAYCHKSWV